MRLERGSILSNREISRIFNVCIRRGIRYHGSLKDGVKHVVLVTVLRKTPEEALRIPYADRMVGEYILYTGEGRLGNQKMDRGNLALKMQTKEKYPIYVFEKKTPGRYMFLGQYDVKSVRKETQLDANGLKRKVYLYKLEMVSASVIVPADKAESLLSRGGGKCLS